VIERAPRVLEADDRERFERVVMPHQDAAFNLARWLLRNRADAEDVTQEALVRAYRFFTGFNGGDARAWLLQIVRNACYTWMEKNRAVDLTTEFDERFTSRERQRRKRRRWPRTSGSD